VPSWLKSYDRLTVVRHDRILASAYLPTFNSHVIESALHNIDGLSEHYIYFNDDVLLTRPSAPQDFFADNGLLFFFLTGRELSPALSSESDTKTELAAKNARNLIRREWGVDLSRMPAHICMPQRKFDAVENERRFAVEYDRFRANRFRSASDVFCTGFLNPYASFLEARAVIRRVSWARIAMRDPWATRHYAKMLRLRGTPAAPLALNIQNDPATVPLPDFAERLNSFLEAYFPNPSPVESNS
jgi:hypothetical protein